MSVPSSRFRRVIAPLAVAALLAVGGCRRPAESPIRAPSGGAGSLRFAEAAERLGIRFSYDNGGSGRFYYTEVVGGGGALFDYDGDGWLDVYLPQGAPLPGYAGKTALTNHLYRNLAGLGFEDVTDRAGVSGVRNGKKVYCIGSAVGDFDNDGDRDLFVTGFQGCLLYRNNGDGTFTDVTRASGIADSRFGSSAAFLDYDRDGRLDLFVCEYVSYQLGDDVRCGNARQERDFCQPGYFPPARSRLYRNVGNGRFKDATAAAGITSDYNKALGVVAGDIDDDGWPDLYVACDLTPNLLYLNLHNGRFREEAISRGCALSAVGEPDSGMGVDLRDVDGDLLPDLFVTNYWAQYNALYHNLGGAQFGEKGSASGLGGPNTRQVSFGTGLQDFNNDGWPDLYVSNGHVLLHTEQSTPGAPRLQTDQVFLNLGQGQFREVSAAAGPWFQTPHLGRGAAFGDVDNNGTVDVLLVSGEGPAALLLNETPRAGNWLKIRLEGSRSNRDGIGARIDVTVNGRVLRDEVRSAYSYASASDLRAHFGLGAAAKAEQVAIRWPSGQKDTFADLSANRIYTLVEGGQVR